MIPAYASQSGTSRVVKSVYVPTRRIKSTIAAMMRSSMVLLVWHNVYKLCSLHGTTVFGDNNKVPRHVALCEQDVVVFAQRAGVSVSVACARKFSGVKRVLRVLLEQGVPFVTFWLLGKKHSAEEIVGVHDLFRDEELLSLLSEFQAKVNVVGHWYRLPPDVVDAVKNVLDVTAGCERCFVNFCVNYDGQEEIVDAVKLVAKQLSDGRVDAEMVSEVMVKENLYTSGFLPPEIILVCGGRKKLGSFLLWDSIYADIIFLEQWWAEMQAEDVARILRRS